MSKQVLGSLAVRLAVATVAAGLFVGCEKSETKPADATKSASDAAKSAASDAKAAASDASKSAGDAAKSAADAGKSATDAGATAAGDAAKGATDAGKSAADAAGAAASNAAAKVAGDKPADAAAAAAPADAAAGDATTKASELLTQVTNYVKENKMDLAEKALAELDKLKPNLPADYQSKIDGAHKMFDAAKSGKGLGELKDNLLGK